MTATPYTVTIADRRRAAFDYLNLSMPLSADDKAAVSEIQTMSNNQIASLRAGLSVEAERERHTAVAIVQTFQAVREIEDEALTRLSEDEYNAQLVAGRDNTDQIGARRMSARLLNLMVAQVDVPFTATDRATMQVARCLADVKIARLPDVGAERAEDVAQDECDALMSHVQEQAVARLSMDEYADYINNGPKNDGQQLFPGKFRLPGIAGVWSGYEIAPDYYFGCPNPVFDFQTCDAIRHAFNATPALVHQFGEIFYDNETGQFCCNGEEGDDDLLTYDAINSTQDLPTMWGLGRYDFPWERDHDRDVLNAVTDLEGGAN